MRILTRRIGESLCVGDGVKILVLDVQGAFARIGVVAPDDTVVCNEEQFEAHRCGTLTTGLPILGRIDRLTRNSPSPRHPGDGD